MNARLKNRYAAALLALLAVLAIVVWQMPPAHADEVQLQAHARKVRPLAAEVGSPATRFEVGFSSKGDMTAKPVVIAFIDAAREQLLLAAYQLTEPDIIRALVRAKQRGVDVQVVLDKSLTKKEAPQIMNQAGIGCRIQRQYQIMHHKFIVTDSRNVENGSFNYTRNATLNNAENALAIYDAPAELVGQYQMQFTALWAGGVPC